MKETENVLAALLAEIELVPFMEGIELLHGALGRLSEARFLLPKEPWLNTFELAAIAKLIYLDGRNRQSGPPRNLNDILNIYKALWRATEANTPYSEEPDNIASFILRFSYQQLPCVMTPERMQQNYVRTVSMFNSQSPSSQKLRSIFEQSVGIPFLSFIEAAKAIFAAFKGRSNFADDELKASLSKYFEAKTISTSLGFFSATRKQFNVYRKSITASTPAHLPYEFNPLFRFPVLYRHGHYCCAYPELVNYAATRGLYFYFTDTLKNGFGQIFSDAFEEYLYLLWSQVIDPSRIITEKMERSMGLQGKENDVTIIFENSAVLFECKNSGLFSLSKKSAAPEDLIADVKRNLANAEKGKGLFQLYEKIQSIRSGRLPGDLKELYSTVQTIYPVILLYDEIWFANRPETLRNIIDNELRSNGIYDFDYQIWHIEELEFLLSSVPIGEIPALIAKKFEDSGCRSLDLSSYLAQLPGLGHLKTALFTPSGDSQAWQILRRLAESDRDCTPSQSTGGLGGPDLES